MMAPGRPVKITFAEMRERGPKVHVAIVHEYEWEPSALLRILSRRQLRQILRRTLAT